MYVLTTLIQATAVQYLKRFYLTNSLMTYHPNELMNSAVFLATKTDNHYISLKSFASKLPKTTEEAVIAPEFLLAQGLQFTFDVRHPFRGLDGGLMELNSIAAGTYQPPPSLSSSSFTADLQPALLALPLASGAALRAPMTAADARARIKHAYARAKDVLKTAALLSDAYFLFAPAHIWLAALLSVDAPLADLYLRAHLAPAAHATVRAHVDACAEMLAAAADVAGEPAPEERRELMRIDRKLFRCRNPDKVDLVGLHRAQKRDDGVDAVEKAAKKRKVEKDRAAVDADDVFGPALGK